MRKNALAYTGVTLSLLFVAACIAFLVRSFWTPDVLIVRWLIFTEPPKHAGTMAKDHERNFSVVCSRGLVEVSWGEMIADAGGALPTFWWICDNPSFLLPGKSLLDSMLGFHVETEPVYPGYSVVFPIWLPMIAIGVPPIYWISRRRRQRRRTCDAQGFPLHSDPS